MLGKKQKIETLAGEITRMVFKELNAKYPEGFPALDQQEILRLVNAAIRLELEKIKSEREQVLTSISDMLSSSIRRWTD